jgi:hypothetical protein
LSAALVDLTDAVAEELDQPRDARPIEMVYRGLSHFSVAFPRGTATDPVADLADPATADLGIRKRRRHHRERPRLDTQPTDLNL